MYQSGIGRQLLVIAACFVGLISRTAVAEVILTQRDSQLGVAYEFGFFGGVNTGLATHSETSINSNFFLSLSGADSGEGLLGDTAWAAAYTFEVNQGIELSSNRIFAYGNTALFSFRGDQGVSTLAAQPGSSVVLLFNNTVLDSFLLSGSLTSGTRFSLEQFDSGNWQDLYTGYGIDSFSQQLLLPAGLFKLSAAGESFADGYASGEAWSFELTAAPVAVPAPASLVLLVTGLFVTGTFRRHAPRRVTAI